MKALCVAGVLALAPFHQAGAWGQEGHSIVAEIAQRRLNPAATDAVNRLLEKASMASIASWADDVRTSRRSTGNWHFADIPIAEDKFDRARDCKPDPDNGDCIVAELERLRNELRCAPTDAAKKEALQFAVHFVGDIHQPLHTVHEQVGGNAVDILIFMRGRTSDRGKLALEFQQPSQRLGRFADLQAGVGVGLDGGKTGAGVAEEQRGGGARHRRRNADGVGGGDAQGCPGHLENDLQAITSSTKTISTRRSRLSSASLAWQACGSRASSTRPTARRSVPCNSPPG